jgi:arabinogalactan endo-1,4-beta-galactosidase
LAQVSGLISSLKAKYAKQVMIVETACPWTNTNADNYANQVDGNTPFTGYTISQAQQLQYMKDFTQAVISGGGAGVMYWEPAWITSALKDKWGTGSSWDNCTLFDFSGNALPAMGYMCNKYQF